MCLTFDVILPYEKQIKIWEAQEESTAYVLVAGEPWLEQVRQVGTQVTRSRVDAEGRRQVVTDARGNETVLEVVRERFVSPGFSIGPLSFSGGTLMPTEEVVGRKSITLKHSCE